MNDLMGSLKAIDFTKEFNARTAHLAPGTPIPVMMQVDMANRSFTFKLKTPPTSWLLMKAAGVDKGDPALYTLFTVLNRNVSRLRTATCIQSSNHASERSEPRAAGRYANQHNWVQGDWPSQLEAYIRDCKDKEDGRSSEAY